MEQKTIKKNDVSIDNLISLMAKYIKECAKGLTEDKPSREVRISINNWYCGSNYNNRKWSNDEIKFNGNSYNFYDKEIGRSGLVKIVQQALDASKVKGKVITNKWESWNGWSSVEHVDFDKLVIWGKPCKEFKTLQSLVKKYANTDLNECGVYYAHVCGKRDSWSESGSAHYLDFDKAQCQKAIDFIRNKRTAKDTMKCNVQNKLVHDDEGDYRCAMYQESEWYGSYMNYMEINIFTPSGKNKGNLNVCSCNAY